MPARTRKAHELQLKRQAIAGRSMLGIDPRKAHHTSAVLDEHGIQQGTCFSFAVTQMHCGPARWFSADYHGRTFTG